MTKSYSLTLKAQDDLQEAWLYISKDNPIAADRVESALYKAFGNLADNPYIGHTRSDINFEHVRFWNVYSDQIIYNPSSQPLQILRILSGLRDINNVLEDEFRDVIS